MSWLGALEDNGGSWLGFGILMMICIWYLVFDMPMSWILSLYLDIKGAKNIHVLLILIGGFGGCWRFLTRVWDLYHDLDMVTGLWYTHIPNFNSLSLSPDFGLWWGMEVPDWGLASWSWFWYGHWSLRHHYSIFWLSILILRVQKTSMSFKSWYGDLEDTRGSWMEFCILILIWILTLVFAIPMFWNLFLYLDFEGAKNLKVVICPSYTDVLNFSSLPWFWRCKGHLCHLSPAWGFWGHWTQNQNLPESPYK